jgi:hypothetical protein
VAPLKKKKKRIKHPLLFTTIINKFGGSCGTFGEEKENPLLSTTLGQFPFFKNKIKNPLIFVFLNDHVVDVSMIIVI